MARAPTPQKVHTIATSLLRFDPENPRFYRLSKKTNDAAVVEEMLDDESVQDIMLSIGQKGYFPGEPLLVVGPAADGTYIVVEGNRRLTATKLLNGELSPPARRAKSVGTIRSEAIVPAPLELPCLVYTERKLVLRYLGYRHITGIKEWDSLSKAKYLYQLKEEFYSDQPQNIQFRSLAKDIGSRPDYVSQLLTALNLYTYAEEEKFFNLSVNADAVEFSYITTALNYRNICQWLGLDGKSDAEMPGLKADKLKKLFSWMFVRDASGYTALGETRNLSEIAEIVANSDAEKILDETGRRSEAYLYTDGPLEALSRAIDEAQSKLNVVWKIFSTPNLILTSEHLEKAEILANLTRDIRGHVRNKLED
ncbi:ParB N-terminal domain-containing protein [Pseudomonas asiatica]|uniref:ParB N-terminal domain-containing protein n=1 Tax=Pseudomonas asiatica TaxID=2219225 RepID=UPI0023684CDC|nr:ParB N-terminal domain-containing protein [Pseudomonas asiatica]WDM88200.1 ParB N-terminal domain-containing protein [Pseudomonas asiatica]